MPFCYLLNIIVSRISYVRQLILVSCMDIFCMICLYFVVCTFVAYSLKDFFAVNVVRSNVRVVWRPMVYKQSKIIRSWTIAYKPKPLKIINMNWTILQNIVNPSLYAKIQDLTNQRAFKNLCLFQHKDPQINLSKGHMKVANCEGPLSLGLGKVSRIFSILHRQEKDRSRIRKSKCCDSSFSDSGSVFLSQVLNGHTIRVAYSYIWTMNKNWYGNLIINVFFYYTDSFSNTCKYFI